MTSRKQQILRGALLGIIGVAMVGCRPGPPRRPLQDADPVFLIPAIKRTAVRERTAAVPRLIELLESEDSAVRLYAIGALREMSGQTLGYSSYGTLQQREEAVDRWRRWAVEEGHLPPEALPATQPGI